MAEPIEKCVCASGSVVQKLPPRWLMLAEIPRMALSLALLPFQLATTNTAPKGTGDPVMVIPGFAASDGSTFVLRRYLSSLGYDVHGWALGRNLGAKTVGIRNEVLLRRLHDVHQRSRRRVTLIGWSMGGIMARMVARARPDMVEQLVTLGAPFTGDPYANHAWELYERMSGHSLSHPVARRQIAQSKLPMPVKSTSIYSKSDGVVAWRCCLEPPTRHSRNIAVDSAHCAFGFNAHVLRAIALTLARV